MGGGGTKKTTVENAPWAPAQSHLKGLYKSAQEAFNATNQQTYGGQTLAGPTQAQRDAVNQVKGLAPQLSAGAQPMQDLALSQLRGDWLSPDTNPYISQVAQAAINPVQQAFDANRLAINDRSISSGAYGGARQDLQQERALDNFTRAAGDITAGIYGQNYANERGIMQNSGQLLEMANALAMAGPTALANAGDVEQGWEQAALDDARNKWLEELASNWSGINEYSNVLTAGGYNTSTKTEPAPSQFANILQGLMGGASTGASLATGIGGVAAGAGLGAFAPYMLPLALLGGLAGGLG